MVSVKSCPHKQAYNTARGKSRWLFGVIYIGGVFLTGGKCCVSVKKNNNNNFEVLKI